MTGFEILHLINIITIWGLSLALFWIIAKMKYSIYKCLVSRYFHKDYYPMRWLMENKHYIFFTLIAWVLIFLSLGLLSQLNEGIIKIRKEYAVASSAFIFFMLIPAIILLYNKAYKHEIK